MNRKLAFLGLTVAVAACGPASLEQKMRDALPRKVAVGTPQDSSAKFRGGDLGQNENNSQVGDHSSYYQLTYDLSRAINGGTAAILGLVKAITDYPATSCSGDTCTWGPGSGALDPNVMKMVVSRRTNPTEHYEYAFSAEPKSKPGSGFIVILSGNAFPTNVPHTGTGDFLIDFDSASKLDQPGQDVGQLAITYSNVATVKVDATFLKTKDDQHPGQRNNALYKYADDASGGGDLQVAVKNTTSNDTLTIHSRWLNTGAGRGDVQAATALWSATASECWDVAPFKVAYWTSTDPAQPTSGVETSCAYAPAAFSSLVAP
jgi:hypothetical protein